MQENRISDSIAYVGVDDKTIGLFENQYDVPDGISYNSYVIFDEKVAVMDTVDGRMLDEWFPRLEAALGMKSPDFLVVSHMEPDHAAGIAAMAGRYPEMKIVGTAKAFSLMAQFFGMDFSPRAVVVKEGDTLSLGAHTLQFFMAPMVHWPEVMVTYEQSEKVLFSADAFGRFGALDTPMEWTDEARRYYINIVGKYGTQVQALLRKASSLDIARILPLHGPVIEGDEIGRCVGLYDTWSRYLPEEKGVFIAVASIYGNTLKAAQEMAGILRRKGAGRVVVCDLAREDMAWAVAEAFRYGTLVVAAASYDGGVFPCMEHFLLHLRDKTFRNRRVGIIENGSWAPVAGKHMAGILGAMKDVTVCGQTVTLRSSHTAENICEMELLADALLAE